MLGLEDPEQTEEPGYQLTFTDNNETRKPDGTSSISGSLCTNDIWSVNSTYNSLI